MTWIWQLLENGHRFTSAGKVTSVFPTKHALGLVTDNGLKSWFNGLDTVILKENHLRLLSGQTVAAGVPMEADLDAIRAAGRNFNNCCLSQMQMRLNPLRSNILVNW